MYDDGSMDLLTVEEAASRLGVQASTIYAYVSRGTLARAPQSQRRQTVFLRSDVEALAERSRRTARTTAATTPRASDISSIVHDTLYYRGREATELAAASSFEAVADFLWDARSRPDDATHAVWAEAASRLPGTEFLSELPASHLPADRFKVTVALAGAADPLRYDFAPTSVRTVGRSLLSALARSLPVPPGHEREAMGESLVDVLGAPVTGRV